MANPAPRVGVGLAAILACVSFASAQELSATVANADLLKNGASPFISVCGLPWW